MAALALLCGTPAVAAVTYVGSQASAFSSSTTSSISITAPAGLSTGDVMIAFVAQNTSGLPAVSSAPAGWTAVLERDDGGSIGGNVYYRIATSADVAGSTSYTWGFQQSARTGGVILDFSGELSSSAIVVSGSQANASSSTYTAPSVTPGVPATMLIALYAADNGNGSVATPAGTTQAFVQDTSAGPNGLVIGAFYESLAASGATGQIQSMGNDAAVNIGVMLAIQPGAAGAPDHYALSYPSGTSAVNCQPQPVTVTAHTASHAALATTDTIVVSTSTGHGDFTLSSGNGTFAAGASNSGTAKYTYSALDSGAVTLLLRDTYAETVSILVADGAASTTSGSATAAEHLPITFSASGFRITNGANVATAIGTQIAGKTSTQSLALQAVRTDTNTGACTSAFASGTTANISLAYQCNNPTTCVAGQTLAITNNGTTTSIASNPNSGVSAYTTVPLKFSTANAEAPFALNYSDAGQITLYARYNIPLANGAGSGNLMNGASQFVVQPYTFVLSNVKCSTYGAGTCSTALAAPGNNPGAAAASGAAFMPAGQSFSATVTAQNFLGVATPNFGQEVSPQGLTLAANLVAPAGGDAAALNNGSTFGAWSAGAATGTTFNWPEVGVITLTASVANYLGSGLVTGTPSGDVGRFYPSSFAVTLNMPVFGTTCVAGGFSYLGQPLMYIVAPVATVTAQALGGTTTRNYTGPFMKITNGSLTGRTYTPTPASPALNVSGLPATSADPVIADLGTGQETLTFNTGAGLLFTRGSAIAPFNANIALSINVIDTDGVAVTSVGGVAATNPVTFGASGGIAFGAGAAQYYGRLALRDSVGSELLDLPMPLITQYYLNTTVGFTTNTADTCTAAPKLTFSNYQLNLAPGATCVRDTGNPGTSSVGCAAAAPAASCPGPPPAGSQYYPTACAGNFNLTLAAPGAGDNGTLSVTATAPSWLQYTWSGGINGNPVGTGTFGEFPAPASRVHQREVY